MTTRVWDYLSEFEQEREDILGAVEHVFTSGQLVLGDSVRGFESEFAAYHGQAHCVGVDNGTNAIKLGLQAIGVKPGDEVITVSNTAAPTVVAIDAVGATPVFVDVHEDNYLMDVSQVEAAITEKTSCIVPVHLYGQCVDMAPLNEIAARGYLGSYTTDYTWTATHLLRTETLPSSEVATGVGVPAETITHGYNAAGNPLSSSGINAYVSNTSYSPFGEANQFTLGVNTLTGWLTYTRDAQTHRVTQVNLSGQTAPPQLENVVYTYDPAGNITRSVDTQGAPGAAVETQCYTYDRLRQLTQAWSSTDNCATNPTTLGNNTKVGGPQKFWTTWTIDPAGNRTKQVQNAVPGVATPTTTTTYAMA
ncbi:DegT/DnrJ/EryC1/StrS family aminotransferase, partial [Kibdelosporangium lantanae]